MSTKFGTCMSTKFGTIVYKLRDYVPRFRVRFFPFIGPVRQLLFVTVPGIISGKRCADMRGRLLDF